LAPEVGGVETYGVTPVAVFAFLAMPASWARG